MQTTTTTPAVSPTHWGKPTIYTVSDGNKLFATTDKRTRTVTTLRAVDPEQVAADLNQLHSLVDFDRAPWLLSQLADAGVDTSTLSNDQEPANEHVGIVWHLSRLLDVNPDTLTGHHDPALWIAGPLLRLLSATTANPAASGRALRSELAAILTPLDGTVVRAEYELSGWYNVAPWVDTLDAEELRVLLLRDDYAHTSLCNQLLVDWSFPGGVLEDAAARIDNDPDFALLVNLPDVVRRLHATRPDVLAQVYTDQQPTSRADDVFGQAAALAAELLNR